MSLYNNNDTKQFVDTDSYLVIH